METIKTNNLVLHINGGLGKCIMSTAVIRSYKIANPKSKIVVVSGYPEVYINNPDVEAFYDFASPDLYNRYYGNEEYFVFASDPYFENEWIKNHPIRLIDLWCKMLNVLSVQETPLLFFSGPEVEDLQAMITIDKPLIFLQSHGGSNVTKRNWTRNIPIIELEELLSLFVENNSIVHVCVPGTPVLKNVHNRIETLSRRQAMCMAYYSNILIGIDSYAMHARAANPLAGPTFILMPLAESVVRLGYPMLAHNYITPVPKIKELIDLNEDYYSTLFKYSLEDDSSNCPVLAGEKWFDFSKFRSTE